MIGYMDYILFVYGFSFLLLGWVLLGWARVVEERLPRAWLAWFGLLHGTNEWLDMLAISLGDSPAFKVVRLAVMAASFLPLVEFGRRGLKAQGTHAPGRWIYTPLIALASLGGLEDMSGLNATCRYALGLPAGLLAGVVLLREARRTDTGRRFPLGLMGLAFLVYGPATGLIVPRAAFFPASILNYEAFLAATGFPIQVIRALCAAAASLGVWLGYRHPYDMANRAGWFRRWLIPGAAAALLAGGIVAAHWSGQRADAEMREHLLSQARAVARAIDINRVKDLSFTAADKTNPKFQRLCGQMTAYARAMNLNGIYSMVVRHGAIRFGPKDLAKNDLPDMLPGTVYKKPPAELRESEKEARRLAQETAVIAQIGQIISSTLDLDVVYERFAREAKNLIGFDRITVGIIDRRENPEIRDTRLIMMTSMAQRGDAAQLKEIGFSGYLTKPVRQSHLRECLALVMGREGSPAAKAATPLVTRHTITESRKRRVRILLAEDNSTNQMVALEILEKLGYRADVVADGKEAIDALRRLPYDLVLMDCEMPELDGFEATRIIRNWKLETWNLKLET